MILLEELKSKVDLLSVGMLKACDNVLHCYDIDTLRLSRNTKAANVKVIYHNHHSHLLYSDKRLMTLLDYLEESFKLSEIQSVTYYVPSKKIVFTFDKNRIYLNPEESVIELSNLNKGIKRKLPRNSIRIQLDLIELLFKDTVNSLNKRKTEKVQTYRTSDSFREMLDSINNVVTLNRNYIERPRDIPISTNRVWGPRIAFPNVDYSVQEGYLLDTPVNRETIRQRELLERYNQEILSTFRSTSVSIDELNYTATTMDTESSVNTERLNHLEELLRATEDADATATAIRFAENYF